MTITIEGQPISRLPDNVHNIYEKFPVLKKDAAKFVSKPVQVVRNPANVLYVNQKEYATLHKGDDNINICGSDDATTCHIVVLMNRNESVLCLAHIDSANHKQSLTSIVNEVLLNDSSKLELYIIGGYCDENDVSTVLTLKLLRFFHKLPVHFELKIMCVGTINTYHRDGVNWPIVYGAAASFQTDFEISPAKFNLNVRGPHLALRSARLFCHQEHLYRVYHSKEGVFIIEPFDYRYQHHTSQFLQKSDDYIRNNFSTSPAVEPPHFSQEMKQVFLFVTQNPYPMNSIFKCKQPLKFSLSSFGEWQESE